MMWDRVLRRILATMEADSVLSAIYGEKMRMAGSGSAFDPQNPTPTLEYTLIGDTESELWAPMIVQFDQFTPTFEGVTRSERRLRTLFHTQLPTDIGGVLMFAEYQDGTDLGSPGRNGFSGRAVRFRFTPLRELYAGLAPSD